METSTRSGLPAHLWFRNSQLIFGAWRGLDGWWRATAWYLDGRSQQGTEGLDLAPAPAVHELAEAAL